MTVVGVIETGGTTTRAAIADCAPDRAIRAAVPAAPGHGCDSLPLLLARQSFATGDPETTLAQVVAWFRGSELAALGVAAFGPLELRSGAPDHGRLLATPKAGWSRFPLRKALEDALRLPVAIDTDVGAAALAEQHAAPAQGRDAATLAYVTVGAGIGVGLALAGAIHHGALHPEAGHLRVARVAGDRFPGLCPFHGDCLEGLASGPAVAARAGGEPAQLPAESAALRHALAIEADYLAQLVVALVGLVAPHRIVLGGGVLQNPGLLDAIRVRAVALAAGYSPLLADRERATALLAAPACGGDAGLLGAALLAGQAIARC